MESDLALSEAGLAVDTFLEGFLQGGGPAPQNSEFVD
jgi:hypothetical protein